MGQSGAVAMLILLFLAVTSACSAEQIAVSSVLTYDIYGTYINKNPSEKQILWCSHACILGCSIFMGAIATAFLYIGISMGYLYELMGCIIGSAVVPISLCITWKKANGTGAVVGAIVGFMAAIAGWIGITASLNNGVVNVDTTFGDYEVSRVLRHLVGNSSADDLCYRCSPETSLQSVSAVSSPSAGRSFARPTSTGMSRALSTPKLDLR